MFGNKDKHPSYGMLQFSRVSGGETSLFGSSIQHRDTIRMYLREGEVTRELSNDFYYGGNEIVEVKMSYSQFAELITSMNQGTGVLVTLNILKAKEKLKIVLLKVKKNSLRMNLKTISKRQMKQQMNC